MRLGSRLQAAIEIVEDIDRQHRPAADALKDWGRSHRFAGSGDRAAIGNLVYDALRKKRTASRLLGADTARAAVLGAALLAEIVTTDSLNVAFDGDRHAPELLSDAERHAIKAFNPKTLSDVVRASVPDWCVSELKSTFGDDWVFEADALAARPPLDLRINTIKAKRDRVGSAIESTGAAMCEIAPHGLRIPPISGHGRHPNVQIEAAFQNGWFEVQDEGSQIVSHLTAASGSQQVLDFCAGAGGKTLALSAAMENKGQIVAHDAERKRLAKIYDRLKRAGCRNVQVTADTFDLAALEGRMDVVLVDAPCTGSGTWRRRPDAKWLLTERQLEARCAEQAAILGEASRYVRPGGRLVYITCSVFHCENDAQIEAFLDRFEQFSSLGGEQIWSAGFASQSDKRRIMEHGLLLSPQVTGTDGFYMSTMLRG